MSVCLGLSVGRSVCGGRLDCRSVRGRSEDCRSVMGRSEDCRSVRCPRFSVAWVCLSDCLSVRGRQLSVVWVCRSVGRRWSVGRWGVGLVPGLLELVLAIIMWPGL